MWPVSYIADADVDEVLDRELRDLLSTCFTKPQDIVFKERRYFRESPAHRWLIRDASGRLLAHLAAHDRRVESGALRARVGGIAEVCVHPDARGQRLASYLLEAAQSDLARRGYLFVALFGSRSVYAASGYTVPECVWIGPGEDGRWIAASGIMVRPLAGNLWPTGEVYLPGPAF